MLQQWLDNKKLRKYIKGCLLIDLKKPLLQGEIREHHGYGNMVVLDGNKGEAKYYDYIYSKGNLYTVHLIQQGGLYTGVGDIID